MLRYRLARFGEVPVLSNETAQLFAERPGARFERRIAQALARLDGEGRGRKQQEREDGEKRLHECCNCCTSGNSSCATWRSLKGPTKRWRMRPSLSMT